MAVEKRQRDRRYEDYMTNRILAVFTYAFLLILGLMFSYRMYTGIETMFVMRNVLYVIAGVALVLTIVAVIRAIFVPAPEYKVFCAKNIAVGAAILAFCAFCGAYFFVSGIRMMYVFVPIVSALMLIYLLYPRDFFFISLVSACAAVLLWYISSSTGNGFIWTRGIKAGKALYGMVVALVLLGAYAIAVLRLKSVDGKIKLGKREREIFPKSAHYLLSVITAAVAAVLLLAGFIGGGAVAYYLVFAMVAYLFVLAVYYTVKMM